MSQLIEIMDCYSATFWGDQHTARSEREMRDRLAGYVEANGLIASDYSREIDAAVKEMKPLESRTIRTNVANAKEKASLNAILKDKKAGCDVGDRILSLVRSIADKVATSAGGAGRLSDKQDRDAIDNAVSDIVRTITEFPSMAHGAIDSISDAIVEYRVSQYQENAIRRIADFGGESVIRSNMNQVKDFDAIDAIVAENSNPS